MKTICAWCGFLIQDGPPEPVSHGMCQQCFDAWVPPLVQRGRNLYLNPDFIRSMK